MRGKLHSCVIECLKARVGLKAAIYIWMCVVSLGSMIPDKGFSRWVPLTISGAMAENIVFPADAGIVNVKHFGAMGDGKTDDTVAIQHALDSLRERQLLYFPHGTYLVSQTLTYPRVSRNLITQGQSRDSTIIKLKDRAASFDDPAHPQPVIATRDGNTAFGYGFFNLTIDIGSGNPGASGIDYISNNQGAIDRVRIVSSDSAKRGARGLDMSRKWPGPALVQHVEVDGFDYGIYIDQWIYSMTFEHLTLKGQRQAGIRNQNNVIAIRDLKSVNTVPVIQNRSGTVTLVDGQFDGGSPSVTAIEHEGRQRGVLFVRNIATSGYRSAIASNGQDIPGQAIAEYTSEPPRQVFDSANLHSLNLRVEETPDVPWDAEQDFTQWVNVADFGARPNDGQDDTDAVQRAIDAANRTGKTTVYFPYGEYYLSKIIRVWGSVRRLIGMTAFLTITDPLMSARGPLFRLEPGQDVVVFERMYARPQNRSNDFEFIRHAAPNTVVFKHGRGGIYRNVVTGGRAFFEDWTSYLRVGGPQQVWVRQWNPEIGKSKKIFTRAVNDGGTLWVLMMKTEGNGVHVENIHGGKVEILGMLSGWTLGDTSEYADFVNHDSQLSLSGFQPAYQRVVIETRHRETATLSNEKPGRFALYVGGGGLPARQLRPSPMR